MAEMKLTTNLTLVLRDNSEIYLHSHKRIYDLVLTCKHRISFYSAKIENYLFDCMYFKCKLCDCRITLTDFKIIFY